MPPFPMFGIFVVMLLLCSWQLNSLNKNFLTDSADESQRKSDSSLTKACVGGLADLSYTPTCFAEVTMSS